MESAGDVQRHSAELRKELGLLDLVLAQILYVVGSAWVGTAARLGDQHVVFWIAAIVLFYLPLAAVIIYLNRLMPLEGGLYQWTKLGFNAFSAFIVGWNLWLYIILFISSMGLMLATNISYALGPGFSWLGSNKWCIAAVTVTLVAGLAIIATLGLRTGKWVQNAGAVFQLATFAALIFLPLTGRARDYTPFHIAIPAISLFSLNIFGKISMGAFSGFEYVAILAGECRSPARTIGRSVLLASPVIACMFILGASSVLAYISPDNVDLVGPVPQTLSAGLRRFGIGSAAASAIILMLVGRQIGVATLAITGVTRLPMVAGWDRLLPAWFSKLHPRYRTPVNSILVVNLMILLMAFAGIAGVGHQEAFQILDSASNAFYGIAYLFMFAIPVLGFRGSAVKAPLWLRAASLSGFTVTLLSCVLSIFPIVQVASWLSFGLKVGGIILIANLAGIYLYLARPGRAALAHSAD
jgi:amino acid transporter